MWFEYVAKTQQNKKSKGNDATADAGSRQPSPPPYSPPSSPAASPLPSQSILEQQQQTPRSGRLVEPGPAIVTAAQSGGGGSSSSGGGGSINGFGKDGKASDKALPASNSAALPSEPKRKELRSSPNNTLHERHVTTLFPPSSTLFFLGSTRGQRWRYPPDGDWKYSHQ